MSNEVPAGWRQLAAATDYNTHDVYRDGDVVHKSAHPWTPTVHALLEHLERRSFPAPRVLGSGFDSAGRETISYVEGEVVYVGPWSDRAAKEIGTMLRLLHEATRDFVPPRDAVWFPWWGRHAGATLTVIGHCDLGPWNIVQRDDMPVAFIDWDRSGPTDPVWELAQVCWLNAKLHDDIVAEQEGLPSLDRRAAQLRRIVDGYELESRYRGRFVQRVIDVATLDAVAEADEWNIRPDSTPASLAGEVPWALAWRTRAAGWMIRHRDVLEDALL
jgi:hypothetical protein